MINDSFNSKKDCGETLPSKGKDRICLNCGSSIVEDKEKVNYKVKIYYIIEKQNKYTLIAFDCIFIVLTFLFLIIY